MLTTSQHGEYFLPCVFYRIYGEWKDFARVFPSVRVYSSDLVHFYDVDREYFWVWIISWDEVVKCDPVVVDAAKAMEIVSFHDHGTDDFSNRGLTSVVFCLLLPRPSTHPAPLEPPHLRSPHTVSDV